MKCSCFLQYLKALYPHDKFVFSFSHPLSTNVLDHGHSLTKHIMVKKIFSGVF